MNTESYILDTPLPLNQDFTLLKEMGIGYINAFGGSEWTNFNTSDPGITILEQVVFALTELGYCGDFPVQDILTASDGEVDLQGQAYWPGEILTTAPVTAEDYRKYIADGIIGIANCLLVPNKTRQTKIYDVYIQIIDSIQDKAVIDNIYTSVEHLLNNSRNLGELFNKPKGFDVTSYFIAGEIEVLNRQQLVNILALASQKLQEYILPPVFESVYKPGDDGAAALYNGPRLQHAWTPCTTPGTLRTSLGTAELAGMLSGVAGIVSAFVEHFVDKTGAPVTGNQVSAADGGLLSIDLLGSINNGYLKIMINGILLDLPPMESFPSPVQPMPAPLEPPVVKGKWRDISNYYSIQNTFPEIFAVGNNSPGQGANKLQIAQSRQLKGYLTLFDQVLANQFAQVANVGNLLSFKNALSGAPRDEAAFYNAKNSHERENPVYPAPYQSFAPTYFYQSLYSIPQIKSLLKNHESFAFSDTPSLRKDLEEKSWGAYKQDPYNPYIRGLMDIMEDESTNLERRNNILDHLLARHGEPPAVIDALIEGSPYTGNGLKDRLIFKSLYLQNLGVLSYYRHKGYNYQGAAKIDGGPPVLPTNLDQTDSATDFIFNIDDASAQEQLAEQDFSDYAGVELKLSLLLGLKAYIKNYLAANTPGLEAQLALWLLQQRKGAIFIETCLLYQNIDGDRGIAPGYGAALILPAFVPPFNTGAFKTKLETFLQYNLPVYFTCRAFYYDSAELAELVPAFAEWHNLLRGADGWAAEGLAQSAKTLAGILTKNDKTTNEQ